MTLPWIRKRREQLEARLLELEQDDLDDGGCGAQGCGVHVVVEQSDRWKARAERLERERDAAKDQIEVLEVANERSIDLELALHAAEARADRLEEALRRLQMGPDTLTQDGLRIVLDALYPSVLDASEEER